MGANSLSCYVPTKKRKTQHVHGAYKTKRPSLQPNAPRARVLRVTTAERDTCTSTQSHTYRRFCATAPNTGCIPPKSKLAQSLVGRAVQANLLLTSSKNWLHPKFLHLSPPAFAGTAAVVGGGAPANKRAAGWTAAPYVVPRGRGVKGNKGNKGNKGGGGGRVGGASMK